MNRIEQENKNRDRSMRLKRNTRFGNSKSCLRTEKSTETFLKKEVLFLQ